MDVTIFTRGRSAVPWLDRVTSLVGDRGPFDATDRFGYWVARFVHPQLLGDRPPRAVVPEPPERPLQFIDARDLAAWMLDLLERDVAGAFNAASPAWQWRMNDFVKALIAASPAAPRPAWIDEPRLVAAGVEPWTGLPMWLPASDADSAGFMTMNCERAQRAGLVARPLAATIADTATGSRSATTRTRGSMCYPPTPSASSCRSDLCARTAATDDRSHRAMLFPNVLRAGCLTQRGCNCQPPAAHDLRIGTSDKIRAIARVIC
jgi:hypothetical protein